MMAQIAGRFGVSARILPLVLHGQSGSTQRNVQVDHLVIAGWTGRDRAALEKHIVELEAIGIKRPATVPIFYRAAAARLTRGARRGIERGGGVRAAAARRAFMGRRRVRPYRP